MWEYLIYQYGTQIMLVVIAVIFGGLGYLAKKVADKLVSNQIICTVAKTAVQYVEQVCKDIHGQDKLNKALEAAADLLAEKGIHLTVAQLTVYIEAALAEFNKAFSAA